MDAIRKVAVLQAPRSRVWRAISTVREFNSWFGVDLAGEFAAGAHLRGHITHPGYEHLVAELWVERVEPEHHLSFRWHPYAVEPGRDYSGEPTTLVALELAEVPGGTQLTIVESGFDALPPERRDQAWRMNDGGWTTQLDNVAQHVTR